MPAPSPQISARVSLADYLRMEETSDQRHEFRDGRVLAMRADTYDHACITTNLTGATGKRLTSGPCLVLNSSMRVATAETRHFVYPDALIVCGPPQFHPEDLKRTTLINPRVVFEVLSDSTSAYDRGEKFDHYRRIPTLEEYMLVAQHQPLVQGFLRQPDSTWSMATWEGLEAVARVRCLDLDLPLAELYEGLTFEAVEGAA